MDAEAAMAEMRRSMSWQEWEDAFDGMLREGGWEWWRDRVVKVRWIRTTLHRYGVPNSVIEQIIGHIMRSNRIAGLPDRLIRRTFQEGDTYSLQLMELAGLSPPNPVALVAPFTILGFVELKTGRGKATPEQREWLDATALCPGVFSLVARPEQTPYLRKVLCLR